MHQFYMIPFDASGTTYKHHEHAGIGRKETGGSAPDAQDGARQAYRTSDDETFLCMRLDSMRYE